MRAALHTTGQGCRAWRKRPPGARDLRDAEPAAATSEICAAGRGIHGAPKAFAELGRSGERASRKRAARIVRENGRAGTTRGRARRPKGGERPAAPQANAAPDLVRREFRADGPNRAWFAGITYAGTHQGWIYPAVVMGIWSRGTVGWSMAPRMAAEPADGALGTAIAGRRPPRGCIRHSGHGPRHASPPLGKTMRAAGIRPSMGPVSSPWDNAAMESLMGPVEAGCVHARTFGTRDRAALEIFECIGCSCSRARMHSALGSLGPEKLEARHTEDAAPRAA